MAQQTPDSPWRGTGDTTREAFKLELANSPVLAEVDALYEAASPYQRLYLGHSKVENDHDTLGILIGPQMHNNLALRPRGYPEEAGTTNGFAVFRTYVDCLKAWRRRLTDTSIDTGKVPKNYVAARTMLEYCQVYNPSGDTHPITGVPNRSEIYCDRLLATINRLPENGAPVSDLNMTKGLIPLPPYADRLITNKPVGAGWGSYGRRVVKGFVLHRMQGTLWGTDSYFRDPTVRALTDFGCDHQSRDVIRWCDPYGLISPWASGPVSNPYGDGKAFVDKYAAENLNVVNRDQVSWEVSGWFVQPAESSREDDWLDASIQTTAQALAHFAHDYGIPWDVFPIAPQDGFSFLRWHNEFIGPPQLDATWRVPKVCPGRRLMDLTDDLIARAKAIMQRYQTAAQPIPIPVYAQPDPIEAFDGKNGQDVTYNNVLFYWCERSYMAGETTPVLQYADRKSKKLRADLKRGDVFQAQRWFVTEGEAWAYSAYGSRIPLKDCAPQVVFTPKT